MKKLLIVLGLFWLLFDLAGDGLTGMIHQGALQWTDLSVILEKQFNNGFPDASSDKSNFVAILLPLYSLDSCRSCHYQLIVAEVSHPNKIIQCHLYSSGGIPL
jgi:hypothetical protein